MKNEIYKRKAIFRYLFVVLVLFGSILLVPKTVKASTLNSTLNETVATTDITVVEEKSYFTFDLTAEDSADTEALMSESELSAGELYTLDSTCVHTYASGYVVNHLLYSDGSCITYYYNAMICTKCGLILKGSLSSTIYYAVCPH